MKSKQKIIPWLIGALAFGLLAGCESSRDQYRGGYGGYEQEQVTGDQRQNWEQDNPGSPYEWQHPSPRPQMER